MIGSAGFIVNSLALSAVLYLVHLDKYAAWFPAFLVAVTFTWWGNRTLTFRDAAASKGLVQEWGKFVVANSLGAAANFATYFVLIRFAPLPLGYPLVAIAGGTLVGLVFNFAASKRFVFRSSSTKAP
jgi:putative flippase GtrA